MPVLVLIDGRHLKPSEPPGREKLGGQSGHIARLASCGDRLLELGKLFGRKSPA